MRGDLFKKIYGFRLGGHELCPQLLHIPYKNDLIIIVKKY
jgi:hypothetical protein